MKAEQAIERYLCRKVKELGGMCIKLVGYNGIPDRLIILQDRCVFAELKCDSGRISPIQAIIHDRLRRMGQTVYVLWSFADVDKCIEDIK